MRIDVFMPHIHVDSIDVLYLNVCDAYIYLAFVHHVKVAIES